MVIMNRWPALPYTHFANTGILQRKPSVAQSRSKDYRSMVRCKKSLLFPAIRWELIDLYLTFFPRKTSPSKAPPIIARLCFGLPTWLAKTTCFARTPTACTSNSSSV